MAAQRRCGRGYRHVVLPKRLTIISNMTHLSRFDVNDR
jgi:hypothetical protein